MDIIPSQNKLTLILFSSASRCFLDLFLPSVEIHSFGIPQGSEAGTFSTKKIYIGQGSSKPSANSMARKSDFEKNLR